MNKKHIVICSHGFGEKKEGRGMFSGLADILPEAEVVMFDYNDIKKNGDMTIRTPEEQVKILKNVIEEQKEKHPDAIIDLVAHSMGSVITAKVNAEGIRTTILLTPPKEFGTSKMAERYAANPLTKTDEEGNTYLPRSDGSTTLMTKEFQEQTLAITNVPELYSNLKAERKIIITAKDDGVLADFDWKDENITGFEFIELPGDHNFSKEHRPKLIETLRELILQ